MVDPEILRDLRLMQKAMSLRKEGCRLINGWRGEDAGGFTAIYPDNTACKFTWNSKSGWSEGDILPLTGVELSLMLNEHTGA